MYFISDASDYFRIDPISTTFIAREQNLDHCRITPFLLL